MAGSYTFDEAIALCGTGKFHNFLFTICELCLLTFMAEIASVGFYIMFAKCDMDMTVYEQGLLLSAAFIGIVVSSHTWGCISEAWSRVKVIRVCMIGTIVLAIISAFSNTTWMFILLRILVGVFVSGTQCSIFSYLGEFHSNRTRTKAITWLTAGFPLSLVLDAILAIFILPLKFDWQLYGKNLSSWRLLEIACIIPGIIASIGLLFLPESPKYLLAKNNPEGSLTILRSIYSINTGNRKEEFPVEKFSDQQAACGNSKDVDGIRSAAVLMWNQTKPLFSKDHIWTSLNLFVHIFVTQFVIQGMFLWLPEIVNTILKHTDSHMTICEIMRYEIDVTANLTGRSTGNVGCATYVDTAMYLALITMTGVFTILPVFMGYLNKIVGNRQFLILWLLISGCCGVSLVFSRNIILNLMLFFGFLVTSACTGIIVAISTDYYPTNISAMAMGMIMAFGRFSSMIASNLIGMMVNYQCEVLFCGLGTCVFALVLLSLQLPNYFPEKIRSSKSVKVASKSKDKNHTGAITDLKKPTPPFSL